VSAQDQAGPAPRTAYLATLGCKVNQQDSAAMGEMLRHCGWRILSDPGEAPGGPEVIVVNSCAVTGRAAAKSRQAVRSLARRFPRSRVVLAGCYPQVEPGAAAGVAGVAATAGTGREATVNLILGTGAGNSGTFSVGQRFEQLPAALVDGRVRAYLKVQEGCAAGCAYCVVPLARGPERSLPIAAATEQARALIVRGARELVLTGIRLGAYDGGGAAAASAGAASDAGAIPSVGAASGGGAASDAGEAATSPLAELIRRCSSLTGLVRLRLSSLEPGDLDDGVLRAMAEGQPVVCPHMHLPLQSGSDRILRAMGRDYSASGYLGLVDKARSIVPGLAVSADVMAGFPGETDEDLAATVRVARAAGLMRLHVFPYSPRPGTGAAAMAGQVPAAAREERARVLIGVGQELRLAYHRRFLGHEVRVLLESARSDGRGGFQGEGMIPQYVRLEVDGLGEDDAPGDILDVRVIAATNAGLAGRPAARARHGGAAGDART
jgi:threonylcarbamoyladenosine tRNA methylthiotransferase MtaB